jgi:hypothetical protein
MLLLETKVTQQSHQEVWFGSAEHGPVGLQHRWRWLQLIKCFNGMTLMFLGIDL